MNQDGVIWGIAAGLSLALHLMVLLDTGSVAGQEKKTVQQQTTRVSFRTAPAEKATPQEAPPEPEKKVVEPPKPPPKPAKKKKAKRVEKVRQPQPPQPPPQQVVEQVEAATGTIDDPALLERAKHEYLRRLMAHIESHKRYPRVARRRGIEGEVEVSFRLLQGGEIGGVAIAQGHRLLRQAVEEAIDSARPMPTPPPELQVPMAISFKVKFSLHNG